MHFLLRYARERAARIYHRIGVERNRRFLNRLGVDGEGRLQPIFVIGPPRTGSTLFYQGMTHYFDFCYFTNEMMRHPYDLALYVHRARPDLGHASDFVSRHGMAAGKTAPHEGYPYWRRFYPRTAHDYVERHGLSEGEEREIRQTVEFLEAAYGKPFLAKNMEMSLRLRSLQKVFPRAVYLIMKRDPRGTASSIIGARLRTSGARDPWWSMQPVEYPDLCRRDVATQLAGQLLGVYRAIYEDLSDDSRRRTAAVWYEDFCLNPKNELEKIGAFLRQMGLNVQRTGRDMPESFAIKREYMLDASEMSKFIKIVEDDGLFREHLEFRLDKLSKVRG